MVNAKLLSKVVTQCIIVIKLTHFGFGAKRDVMFEMMSTFMREKKFMRNLVFTFGKCSTTPFHTELFFDHHHANTRN